MPVASVTDVRRALVSIFSRVMLAPSRNAPPGSDTVPRMDVVACAHTSVDMSEKMTLAKTQNRPVTCLRAFIFLSLARMSFFKVRTVRDILLLNGAKVKFE